MAKLKRDQRVCPFCAETIKASAIRCRFCHADVAPVVEPAAPSDRHESPAVLDETADAAAVDADSASCDELSEESGVGTAQTSSAGSTKKPAWRQYVTLVLAALVAVAAVGVGALWWRAEHASSASAAGGVLVAEEARTEAVVAAADLAQRTLSYDYQSLENDMEVARARMTPSFRKEYESTMAQVKDNTEKNKIVLQAVAVSSAIIEATEHEAKVLVFLNQTTTAGTGDDKQQQLNQNSLVITLTRGDGDWAISKLTALG